jgi:threonine dehydrogenase-like Zn-dependent dehydrogenase
MAFMLWAKLGGAERVIALGRRASRLAKSRELGADDVVDTSQTKDVAGEIRRLCGGPVSGIIEATGDAALANSLLPAIAPDDGFACAYGVTATGATPYDKRWTSADVREHLSYAWVAELIRRGWVQARWFTSPDDIFALDDAPAAIDQVRRGQRLKAFIRIAG